MGKIKKAASLKHDNSLSPALAEFIQKTVAVPVPHLLGHLDSFPTRWLFPRGDLFHWIQPLNRFDEILEKVIQHYKLDAGPQVQRFGVSYLRQETQDDKSDPNSSLEDLGYGAEGDRELLESILKFTKVLLEKCGNRNLYASSERLNSLLNTTSLSLLNATLRLALCLAQRHGGRQRNRPPTAQYAIAIPSLLALCSPLENSLRRGESSEPSSPIVGPRQGRRKSHSSGGLDGAQKRADLDLLKLLASDSVAEDSGSLEEWLNVELSFNGSTDVDRISDTSNGHLMREIYNSGNTNNPSPLRRASTDLDSSSRNSIAPENRPIDSSIQPTRQSESRVKKLLVPSSTILNKAVEDVLRENLPKVPPSHQYELASRLRTAYGIATQRRELLISRLLAVSNLAYTLPEAMFEVEVLHKDSERPKDHQLVYLLSSLIHPTSRGLQVSLDLRTVAVTTLRALAKHKAKIHDIFTALGVNVSRGVLHVSLRETLAALSSADVENSASDDELYEHNEATLSLVLSLVAASHTTRSGELISSPEFVSIYNEFLSISTETAERLYLKALEYFDALCQYMKDGLTILFNNGTFEIIIGLFNNEVVSALDLAALGKGVPTEYRVPSMDYYIPYVKQQVIKFLLPFIDKVLGQHSPVVDRILRSLIDNAALLRSLRLIIENSKEFGGHIWAGAIKVLGSILHNEPTSYAVISEAGLSGAFLKTVTLERKSDGPSSRPSSGTDGQANLHDAGLENSHMNMEITTDDNPQAAPRRPSIYASDILMRSYGIPPSTEAISNVAQAFEAICLTSAGFESFQKSSALKAFFSIFESPAHVKVMRSARFLTHIGSVFDELVRHHPALRDAVLSSVLAMVARLRFLCKSKAWSLGAGSKLWSRKSGSDMEVAGGQTALLNGIVAPAGSTDHGLSDLNRTLDLPDGAKLILENIKEPLKVDIVDTIDKDDKGPTVTDFVSCVMSFLSGLFENQALCNSYMEAGGTELVLDFTVLPSLPHDFTRKQRDVSEGPPEIAQVLHSMAESKPHLIIPSLLDRCLRTVRKLESLIADLGSPDFTCKLFLDLSIEPGPKHLEGPQAQIIRDNGTAFVKCLTSINVLVSSLQEIFAPPLYHTRQSQQPSPFLQVNAADMYIELCSKLGCLQAFCLKEEILIDDEASEIWKAAVKIDETGREAEDLKRSMEMFRQHSSYGEDVTDDSEHALHRDVSGTRSEALDHEPGYRNYAVLSHLMKELTVNISKWFQALAQSLIPKRRIDSWQKQNAFKVAGALGDILVYQLRPPFLKSREAYSSESTFRNVKYTYLDKILTTMWEVTMGDNARPQSYGTSQTSCVTAVMVAFKNANGMQLLREISESCYFELSSQRPDRGSANDIVIPHVSQTLSSILAYCDQATSAKCVVESPQSQCLKILERDRPHHFSPAQLLLELRVELLPLIRKIWDSTQDMDSYLVQNGPKAMLESVVHCLRHVLEGDHENEAYKSSDLKNLPGPVPSGAFVLKRDRYSALTAEGYDQSLAREALFRCNNNLPAAQEYCKSFTQWFRESRNPPPISEPAAKTPEEQGSPARTAQASTVEDSDLNLNSASGAHVEVDQTGGSDNPATSLDNIESTDNRDTAGDSVDDDLESLSSDMSIDEPPTRTSVDEGRIDGHGVSSVVNGSKEDQKSKAPTVEDIEAERENIRASLVEQCLNVLNEHHNISFELSDLITAASKKLSSSEASDYRENTGQLVVGMLTSLRFDLQTDGISQEQKVLAGTKIAACAHFLALLLQEKSMYDACVAHLRDLFPTLVEFVKVAPSNGGRKDEDSSPWIAQVLLIVEKMLSDDSEPVEIHWTPPSSDGSLDDRPIASAEPKRIVSSDDKNALFDAIIEVLPKIGKDQSLALSTARVLVILTRVRRLAVRLAEKRNLQRLFLMVKQLTNATNESLHSALMLILRHIVEDDSTLLQIMKSEILANFDSRSSRSATDTTQYLRHMAHLVVRSPDVFIEATNATLKLQRHDAHRSAQALVLKSDVKNDRLGQGEDQSFSTAQNGSIETAAQPESGAAMIQTDEQITVGKGKASETRFPVVENPDGLIHYLLSELLSYKDVEDKESSSAPKGTSSEATAQTNGHTAANGTPSALGSTLLSLTPTQTSGSDANRFKTEDHPIFTYRCFILQCLTELLYCYNRAKIEFINFSRKSDPLASTPSKPRGTVLNYLLNGLIPVALTDSNDTFSTKKKTAVSEWATKVVIALCSKTGELGVVKERFAGGNTAPRVLDNDDEPELSFVRRFVLEHAIKAFQNAATSSELLDMKHARLLGLAELFQRLVQKPTATETSCGANNMSYKMLGKMMVEKNFIQIITSSVADVDLSFLGSKRVVKHILKPLEHLTDIALNVSQQSPINFSPALGQAEQGDISSASSVSEMDNQREQTPDLFRHSTLGLLEPSGDDDESSSDSDEEDEEGDEVYDDEFDGMEYEEDIHPTTANDGEVVSDEEADEVGRGSVEGIPGDVPMDIELVMEDDGMDEDSDEDEEDEDDEDDDMDGDDDDDIDGDDEIEMDEDLVAAGEVNGDDDNASLGDIGEEAGWESEGSAPEELAEGDPEDFQNAMDHVEAVVAGDDPVVEDVQSGLDELLQIVGNDQAEDDQPPTEGIWTTGNPSALFDQTPTNEGAEYEEELEDPDEDEDGSSYHEGNFLFDTDDTSWGWENDDPPPIRSHHHRHRHHFHHGRHAGFFSNLLGQSDLYPRQSPRQGHRDDGSNPLLRRTGVSVPPQQGISFPAMDMIRDFREIGRELSAIPGTSGRHDVMEAILSAVEQGESSIEVLRSSRGFGFRLGPMPRHYRSTSTFPGHPSAALPRSVRDDPQQAVDFHSLVTSARWQEEAKLLYGANYADKAPRINNALMKALVPPAIEEEKARHKKLEEDRKREAEEKAEKERQERVAQELAEKKRKEEDEREAARRAAQEVVAVEAATNASVQAAGQGQPAPGGLPAQDTQENATNAGETISTSGNETDAPAARVYTNIRGRDIDITDMSIDADYLEALPEEFREEVIMRQYAEQRHQAEEQGQTPSDINREFLDALPEDIREELLQQEAQERRQRERDAARRRAAESGGPARAEDMDTDSFLASLDPALRRSILADSPEEVLQTMAPQFVAEARSMMSRTLNQFGRLPMVRDIDDSHQGHNQMTSKDSKRQVIQMLDKSGVATLLRLMFMPLQGATKQTLWTVLHNICQHRQTRAEVINLLLLILQDGSADVSAVERSLGHLSLRARNPVQKPPQLLKRTLSLPAGQSSNFEITPLMVVQQCLGALQALHLENPNVAIGFLRETDGSSSGKPKAKGKGKGKEDRAHKFALNALLGLLNRTMITENSTCMETLSLILANITHALHRALRREKAEDKPNQPASTGSATGQSEAQPQSVQEDEQAQTMRTNSTVPTDDTIMASSTAEGHVEESGSATQQATQTGPDEGPSSTPGQAAPQETPSAKPEKTLEPPVIPEANLRFLVGIVAARECNSKIFRETLSTMMNISLIPGTKEIFGRELISQAQGLCSTILSDLDDLLGSLRDAQDGLDLQSLVFSKFTPSGSDQTKLLRVLTALDYLFDPKRQGPKDTAAPRALDALDDEKLLPILYESPEFGHLWSKVGECLTTIRQKDNMVSVTTILQHLIEALMVVCKNTSLKDMPISRSALDTPVIRGNSLEKLFFTFTEEHRKILNELVRQNPKLMSGSFAVLIKNPKVLDFDNKLSYFRKRIRTRDGRHPQPPLQLSIRRNETFLDSFKSLYFKSAEEMKFGKLSIRFHGEEGVDAGGVTREWFQVLARGMFNPNYALFIPVASDRTTFHPNRLSGVNEEHLLFFKFIGRIIGKALYEDRVLDCHFSRAVYKRILGKTVSLKDMETLDLDYYKSLVWMLENDITDIITENFSVESADFGENRIIDLVPNGRNIPVTEENKQEYVQRVVEYRLTESINEQLENFLKGFYDIIPAEVISIFNEQELELLISGLPDIDIDDWKANTEYHTYNASSPQIQWFWRAVRSFDKEEQAKLLQFVTGTSKVPLNGFKELEGMNGFSKFNIHKDYGNKDRLPSSHTCFNQLDLPEYENYEILRQRLYMAMTTGSEYFGFA